MLVFGRCFDGFLGFLERGQWMDLRLGLGLGGIAGIYTVQKRKEIIPE
jgi:hypothetical protein